jgi:formylglycine-generating enzyme required for sulfatase activity
MTGSLWERARALFEAALELPEAEREAYLRRACGDDQELLAEALALAAHDRDAPDDFIAPPAPDVETPLGIELGDYVLQRELGRGAMGVVYLANQPSLDREVAVKVLTLGLTSTAVSIERFHREARAAARLDHPNIVHVLADGHADNTHWFAMEYVRGHGLDEEIHRLRGESPRPDGSPRLPGPRDPEHITTIARLVAEAASALSHAHSRGVVHRDVKPSNLLLTPELHLKLVDFGIARDETLGSMTKSDQLIGSAPYMSPEQARILHTAVDHRTDIYSLGVVLYELLTLRRPYTGSTSHEVLLRLSSHDPTPLSRLNDRVPRDLALICQHAMSKRPEDRYQTAAALEDDLRRFLRHEAIRARPPSAFTRAKRLVQRRRGLCIGAATALVAVCLAVWFTHRAGVVRAAEAQLAPVRELLALEDWSGLPDTPLVAARAALARARGRGLSPTEQTDAAAFDARLGDFRAGLEDEATELVRQGALAVASGLDDGRGHTQISSSTRIFQRLTTLFPDDPPDPDDSAFAPRLSLQVLDASGTACSGRVSVRRLDPRTAIEGSLDLLGPLPVEGTPLPMGHLRIVVEVDGHGLRELTRFARAGADLSLVLNVRDDQRSTEGMVLLPAATCSPPAHRTSPLQGQTFDVRACWLDEREVSVRDWRSYLAAHPKLPVPDWFATIEPGSERELLPMVLVRYDEAQAYAEWRGKRLPTHAEWVRAARGPGPGRAWPWGEGPAESNTGRTPLPMGDAASRLERYFEDAAPVQSFPGARSVEGLYHLFGNVMEWTESHHAEVDGGLVQPRYDTRIGVGCSWAHGAGYDLRNIARLGLGSADFSIDVGFRCARSAAP